MRGVHRDFCGGAEVLREMCSVAQEDENRGRSGRHQKGEVRRGVTGEEARLKDQKTDGVGRRD